MPPEFRRRFRGRLIVHDVEGEDLVELGTIAGRPVRISPALVETDLVVTVTAAESVLHGGPSALVRACSREVLRASGATSLLETSSSEGWALAVELERLLAARGPVYGVSLVLNLPHVYGGYPYDERSLERIAGSRLRRGLGAAADRSCARRIIERVPRELSAATVLGGTPSAAHSEALLRAIEFKGATLDEPLDAIVIGIPATTPFLPRGAPNPVSAAYLRARPRATALAERASRCVPAARRSCSTTSSAASRLRSRRRTARCSPTRAPRATRMRSARPSGPHSRTSARSPSTAPAARSIRSSRSSSWSACDPALSRLGPVLIAGCRDAHAARQLGLVPVHSFGAALGMARGRGAERIGFLLSPPYFPLVVESDAR